MNKRDRKKYARNPIRSPNYCYDCRGIHPSNYAHCLKHAEQLRLERKARLNAERLTDLEALVPVLECFNIKVQVIGRMGGDPRLSISSNIKDKDNPLW